MVIDHLDKKLVGDSHLSMVLDGCSNSTSINFRKAFVNIECSFLMRIFTITERTFEREGHCQARREFICHQNENKSMNGAHQN